MSNLQQTIVVDQLALTAQGTAYRQTVDLPNSHAISRIFILDVATHATSIDITQSRIEVLGDGSPVISGLSGADLRKLQKFITGRSEAASSAGATSTQTQVINFGRFARDPQFAFPAPLFENPQLVIEGTLTATPVAHTLDVVVEELLGVDPRKCWMRKWSLVAAIASAASQQTDTKLPRGARLSAVYVDYNDVDNVDGDRIELGVNNFSRSVFRARRTAIEAFNRQQFPFDDNAVPTTMFALDLDAFGIVAGALDTRAGSGISDVILRTKCAGSGTSGNVRVIAEEYLPATKDAEASA